MTDIFESERAMLRIAVEEQEFVATLDADLDPDWAAKIPRLLAITQDIASDTPVVPFRNGLRLRADMPPGRLLERSETLERRVALDFVSGLCRYASHLNKFGYCLGPPDRGLVWLSEKPLLLLPAVAGHVHRYELNLRGAAMMMRNFKVSPEMYDETPVAEVFFLTQFLFELLTGHEPFPGRHRDYMTYLQNLRAGPVLPRDIHHPAFSGGLTPDPLDRYPTPAALADTLR